MTPDLSNFAIVSFAEVCDDGSFRLSPSGDFQQNKNLRSFFSIMAERFPDLDIKAKTARSGNLSRRSICAAALLLDQVSARRDLAHYAVVEAGKNGCYDGNMIFWDDYERNNFEIAQAHYFIGTLPSTAVCEIAIAFQIHGMAYHLTPQSPAQEGVLADLRDLFLQGHERVIYLHNLGKSSYAALVQPGGESVIPLSQLSAILHLD